MIQSLARVTTQRSVPDSLRHFARNHVGKRQPASFVTLALEA
ncbi:hypothetical protein [Neorhizobium galegae]|nr:hypothetical protein [Neorhizobium galegae]